MRWPKRKVTELWYQSEHYTVRLMYDTILTERCWKGTLFTRKGGGIVAVFRRPNFLRGYLHTQQLLRQWEEIRESAT